MSTTTVRLPWSWRRDQRFTGAGPVRLALLRRREHPAGAAVVPPLDPRPYLVRTVLVVVVVVATAVLAHLVAVSALQQRAAQQRLFDRFRGELAQGTAPVGPTDFNGRPLALGEPVAFLEVPSIGLRQVVVEGTTGGALFAGPGHRRDTPLPGQVGVSVLAGRRAAFGGPFARLGELDPGATIEVTTGQGVFRFEVTGVRREGDPLPCPSPPGRAGSSWPPPTAGPSCPPACSGSTPIS